MSHSPRRHGAGTHEGGRFAVGTRAEPDLHLDAPSGAAAGTAVGRTAALVRELSCAGDSDAYSFAEATMREAYPQVAPAIISEDFLPAMYAAARAGDDSELDTLSDDLERYAAEETRWREHPTFEPPYTQDLATDGSYYPDHVGSKYTGFRDVAEIAKDVRAEIKDATRVGYLPRGVKYSVTASRFAGGQSLRVVVQGLSDADIYTPEGQITGRNLLNERTALMRRRVQALASAYDRDRSDSMTDYSHNLYFAQVEVEDEAGAAWRADERVRRLAARPHPAA